MMSKKINYILLILIIISLVLIFKETRPKYINTDPKGLIPLIFNAHIDEDKFILNGKLYSFNDLNGNDEKEMTIKKDAKFEIILPEYHYEWRVTDLEEKFYKMERYYPEEYKNIDKFIKTNSDKIEDAETRNVKFIVDTNEINEVTFIYGGGFYDANKNWHYGIPAMKLKIKLE